MAHLPDELLNAIFTEAVPSLPHIPDILPFRPINNNSIGSNPPTVSWDTYRTRHFICSVCSVWRRIALPLLFRDILITGESHAKAILNLLSRPDLSLAPHVHSLWLVYPCGQNSLWRDTSILPTILSLARSSLTVLSLCHSLQYSTSYSPGPFPSPLSPFYSLDPFPALKTIYWNTLFDYAENPALNASLDFIVCRSPNLRLLVFGSMNPDHVFRRNPTLPIARPSVLFPSLHTLVLRDQSTFDNSMVRSEDFPNLDTLVIDQTALNIHPNGPNFTTLSLFIGPRILNLELAGRSTFISLRELLTSFQNVQQLALPLDNVALFVGDNFAYPALRRILLHGVGQHASNNQLQFNLTALSAFHFPHLEKVIASGTIISSLRQLQFLTLHNVPIVDRSGVPI